MVATIEPTSPVWASPSLDCRGCHGAQVTPTVGVAFNSVAGEPNYTGGAAGFASANSHQKHVGSVLAPAQASCANCHSKTTTTGTTIIASSQHLDRFINYTAGNGKTFGKLAAKTCSNISCHSGNGIVVGVANAQWGAVLLCNGCHGGPAALGSNILATGKHTQHINNGNLGNFGCVECHSKTVSSDSVISNVNNHGNAFIDYSGVKAGRSTTYDQVLHTCSATYCHTSGKKGQAGMVATDEPATPSWGAAAMTCTGCHGRSTTAGSFVTVAGEPNYPSGAAGATNANSHLKHVGAAGASTCANCHSKTTADGTTIIAGSQHIDRFNNYTAGNGKTFGKLAAKTCSNISCHSGGGIVSGVANAQWGATLGCNGCHGDASTLVTGTHSRHLAAGLTCNSCHNATASNNTTISTPANHLASNITINFAAAAAPAGATYNSNVAGGSTVYQKAVGLPVGACNNTTCHGGNSTNWGVNTTNDVCTKCHGTMSATITPATRYLVAPPTNTAGATGTPTGTGQVSSDTKVGAHQTHLQYFNGYSNYSTVDFRCQGCHGTLPATSNHASGSSVPAFQGLAIRGGKAPAWTAASFTCSNTYCHNPAGATGGLNATNTGTRTFVSWTASSYLANGTRVTAPANCSKCHKVPGDAGFTSSFAHGATTIANPCVGCHEHEGDASGSSGRRHMDGIKWGGGGTTCDGCHDYDTFGGTWGSVKGINYYSYAPVNQSIGAHYKHIEHLKKRWNVTLNATTDFGVGFGLGNAAKVCGACHTNTLGNHMDTARNINFGDGLSTINGVPMVLGSGSAAYNGSGSYGVYASGNRTCSNLSCHYFTTPLWSTY